MGYASSSVAGTHRWNDLALDTLLPVDRAREEIEKAIQARKMASGAGGGSSNNPHADTAPAQRPQEQAPADTTQETVDEDNEDPDDDDDNHENDFDGSAEDE
jgi:hypothetical protein